MLTRDFGLVAGHGVRGDDLSRGTKRSLCVLDLRLVEARPTVYLVAMGKLNGLAYLIAFVISLGEFARFWGSARFIPMAIDELLVAAVLIWAAWRAPRDGACWHVAAWGAFCGLMLALLVETADHQMHGPVKSAGTLYLVALGGLLIVGLWAVRRALRLLGPNIGR